jgi:hypothetical protein
MVNLDPSRFELVEDNSNVQTLDPSKFELIDDKSQAQPKPVDTLDPSKFELVSDQAQPKPVETPDKIDEDVLDTNKQWLSNAAIIYESEEKEKWKGSQKALSDWMKDRHSKRGWDITNMILSASRIEDLTEEQKRAWRESEAQYKSTDDWDWSQAGRAAWHTITDPIGVATMLPSIIATVMTGGAAAPSIAATRIGVVGFLAKTVFKNNLKDALIKGKVSEKLAEQVVKTGSAKGVKKAVIGKARKEAAKKTALYSGGLGAIEGSVYMTAEDVAQQALDLGLDVDRMKFADAVNEGASYEQAMEIAKKTDFDHLQTAEMALIGTVFGGVMGGGFTHLAEKIGRKSALQKAGWQRQEPEVQKVSEAAIVIGAKDTPNDIISQAGKVRDVEADGTVTVDISRSRQTLADELREMKKTDEWKDMTPKQKREWRTNARKGHAEREEVVKDQFENVGVVLEPVKGQRGKYVGKKITEEVTEEGSGIGDQRKLGERIVAKFKGEFFDDGGTNDFIKAARTRKDSAFKAVERNVEGLLKKYSKAIKKNYELPLRKIPKELNKVLDDAFRGDATQLAKLEREAPETATVIKEMREQIKFLQEDLLKSGAIKEGKAGEELTAKIIASKTDTGKPTLYVTRKYQMHDNPKWTKFLSKTKEGTDIVDKAKDFIVRQASINNKALGVALKKNASQRTAEDNRLLQSYIGKDQYADNVISDILKMNDENDLIKIFEERGLYDNASNILKRRKDIPEEIRDLMGEYDNPISNYANTAMKLFQTIEDFKYERQVADAIKLGDVAGTAGQPLQSKGITTELRSSLPPTKGVVQPLAEEGAEGIMKPLSGMYGTKEVAAFIANGNEMSVSIPKALQTYLMLQGHSRAAKTIWSVTSTARNFLSGGWMALGAGYLNPKHLKEIPRVFRGMYLKSNEALNIDIERGLALGIIQSGTDIGSFRGAMKDAGQESFWDLTSPLYKGERSLIDRAKSANTTAAKFYQSMDDMWKQYAFMNEKGNYRQILIDKFGKDYPDEVTRTLRSTDGLPIEITRLDEAAAEAVNKHMQNYAGVPKFIRRMRLAPFADFLAFKSEMFRTQKNIVKSAFNDIKDGSAMIKKGERNEDGSLKGVAQRNLGLKRAGSFLAAQSAAPALATTSAQLWGMNETLEGQTTTIKAGTEAFEQEYNKGANFFYMGKPDEKGKGRRINISYINPWSPMQDPIMAGFRALNRGEYVDDVVEEAAYRAVVEPLQDAFGPSMIASAISQFMNNVDDYGNPIFDDVTQTTGQNIANGMSTFMQAFEPGGVKSIRDIYQTYNLMDQDKKFGVAKKGRERYRDDAWISLSGVKPERYDISQALSFKLYGLKRDMGATDKIFKNAYQQRSPISVDELVDAYSQGMEKQFALATEMFDYISKAKSAGLSNKQIINAVTENGLFTDRLDNKVLHNMVKKGVFVPQQPLKKDVYLWGISTQKRTGQKPPIREAQRELMNVYRSYVGSRTGVR